MIGRSITHLRAVAVQAVDSVVREFYWQRDFAARGPLGLPHVTTWELPAAFTR
jgi:hypothetical protein